jgi:hypothetical protein
MSDDAPKGYDEVWSLANRLGRKASSLVVLHPDHDPYYAGRESRRAGAEWISALWEELGIRAGAHVRRIHYVLLSQKTPVLLPNGTSYENTLACYVELGQAVRDARYLKLIPGGLLEDHRNPEPVINYIDQRASDAYIHSGGGSVAGSGLHAINPTQIVFPYLNLLAPVASQPYHLEVWCEKSTMNDVLMPLGRRYGVNVVTGVGELSTTACELLVLRAHESQKPCRILYISDFDPSGMNMPVSAAVKIGFCSRGLDLDIQVRPVVLTYDQCVEYALPRTPIKDSDARGDRFEQRFGEGATELDALEALHPGVLREILEDEIARYYDNEIEDNLREAAREVRADLERIESEVRGRYREEIAVLEAERDSINAEAEEALRRQNEREDALRDRTRPLFDRMSADLRDALPDVDDYDWPEADLGDDDPDALFDSTRSYVEQVDRFRLHQGKQRPKALICEACGKSFKSMRSTTKACSKTCQGRLRRARHRGA